MPQKWQEVEVQWHHCHWWRDVEERRLPAMTIFLLVLVLVAISALLVREVLGDEYGRRPVPRSFPPEPPPWR